MMKLFHNPASPFVRKVMVTLIETGQQDDVTLDTVAGSPTAPGQMPLAQNPLGKVPTLIRDSGAAIYDSRVICRFFDGRAGAGLYPESHLWETLTLEATADGIMDAAVLIVYESRCRPEEKRSDEWVERQWDKIVRALDVLESRWMSHLSGPLDMGQIAVGCALGYLDFRHGARNWRQGREALAAWYDGFSERPAMQATRPEL